MATAKIIDPEVLRRAGELRVQFLNAQPFPHVVIDGSSSGFNCRPNPQIRSVDRFAVYFYTRIAGSTSFRLARILTWPLRVLLRRK